MCRCRHTSNNPSHRQPAASSHHQLGCCEGEEGGGAGCSSLLPTLISESESQCFLLFMLWISKCLQSNPKTRIMQPNTGICELDKGNWTKEGLIHHKDLKLKYMYCLWQFLSKYIYKTLRHCSKGNCTHRRTSSTVKDHPTGPTLSSILLKSPTIKQFSSLIFTGWEIPFRYIHTLLIPFDCVITTQIYDYHV